MKTKSSSELAFFTPRVLLGVCCCVAGLFLVFAALGQNESPSSWRPAPVAFDAPGPHAVPPAVGVPKSATESQSTDSPQLSPWTGLTNAFPSGFTEHCMLLTDGTVICHEYGTNRWHRLKPDINGSYKNGTWDVPGFTVAPMPNGNDPSYGCVNCLYQPLFFSSAVLADGRVVVIGGEYNNGFCPNPPNNCGVWTNIGFMYTPVTNTWSTQLITPFINGSAGDAQSVVLQNGTMLVAQITTTNIASFNPATLTFTALAPTGKDDINDEENWNILPNAKVLTVDSRTQRRSELYDAVMNAWETAVDTQVNLADTGAGTANSDEVGPYVARPDGTIIYFSGTNSGLNAVYNINAGTWTPTAAAGNFPVSGTGHFAVADGPASLLPNGNALVMASPVLPTGVFNTPSHFYEFDGTTLTQVADSPNAAAFISYQGRFLVLPTGEVLLTAYDQQNTADIQLYSNGLPPQDAWRPVITSGPAFMAGVTYTISGKLFNGFSEGASYGDDAQMSSNYPIVRIKNLGTGHIFYCRTHDHSRMGVEAVGSNEIVTTLFDTPAGLEAGPGELVVVANGIASAPVPFPPVQTQTLTVTSSNPNNGVTITVSPNDNNGNGNGTTPFTRIYNVNTNVTLTAPPTAGGNVFQKWQRDGVDFTVNSTTIVTMNADHTMNAVYVTPPPPPTPTPTPCVPGSGREVDGIGTIAASGGQASFTFHVRRPLRFNAFAQGYFMYNDPGAGVGIANRKLTRVSINGNHAHFSGQIRMNRKLRGFTVDADDCPDFFSVRIDGFYSRSGPLTDGDIVIHN